MSPVPRPARRCTHPGCTRDQVRSNRCEHHAEARDDQQRARATKQLNELSARRSPAERRKRYGSAWRKQRARILLRDDHTCQACTRDDVRLQVHHLADTATPSDDELVTLCGGCHTRLHAGNRQTIGVLRAGGWPL